MLHVTIPRQDDLWDEAANEFISIREYNLVLEHSLLSLSKWESKWKKPFLSKKDKTYEEIIDYIKCMTITQNVPDMVYNFIPKTVITEIQEYIDDPMTATTFRKQKKEGSSGNGNRIITNELIYYWMISLQIPVEFQKWHLNRLLTLIQVCNEENKEPPKSNPKSLMRHNAALNAANRKRFHSKG